MNVLRSRAARAALIALVVIAVVGVVARLEVGRDLSRLDVGIASGAPEGNYHAVVDKIAAAARVRHGAVANIATAGSVENLAKIEEARASGTCAVSFALIQDGQAWPRTSDGAPTLEVLGKLPRAESVLFLGKNADAVVDFAALAGLRIGIGLDGSGTAKIAREVLESRDFAGLGIVLSTHPLPEQIAMAAAGTLDLAVVVMDEDAPLVERAVREQGLQIASFPHAEVLVGRVPSVHAGRIPAGKYDAVHLLPPADKTVLQLDTLVVGNRCASRSRTVLFLSVVADVFPDFIRTNKSAPNLTGLPLATAAKSFFDNDGPEVFDEYAPWLVDVMPPGKWVYLVTALSLLFNAMGFGHRFQLWRIDAARVRLERELTRCFGATTTLGEIERMSSAPAERAADVFATCARVVRDLEALDERSRKMSLSILVPMGQEMAYRYQEDIIHETLGVLRGFMERARPS